MTDTTITTGGSDSSPDDLFATMRLARVETRCCANLYQQWDVVVPIQLTGKELHQYLAQQLPTLDSHPDWLEVECGETTDDADPDRLLSSVDGNPIDGEVADALAAPARPQEADPSAKRIYTVLLALPGYLQEPATPEEEKHFAVRTRADSPETAVTRAAGYLLWHFDTDYTDRAAAEAAGESVECIGVAKGEITFHADRPITLTAD